MKQTTAVEIGIQNAQAGPPSVRLVTNRLMIPVQEFIMEKAKASIEIIENCLGMAAS